MRSVLRRSSRSHRRRSTIASAKGLEFNRVVVAGLGGRRDDLISGRKSLYVGFTRAVEELAVVSSKDSVFAPGLTEV